MVPEKKTASCLLCRRPEKKMKLMRKRSIRVQCVRECSFSKSSGALARLDVGEPHCLSAEKKGPFARAAMFFQVVVWVLFLLCKPNVKIVSRRIRYSTVNGEIVETLIEILAQKSAKNAKK